MAQASRNKVSGGERRRRRSAGELRSRILAAAAGEFQDRGYSGATTAAIARGAEVTEAQLFRYFSSKAELFHEAVFKPLEEDFLRFNVEHLRAENSAEDHRSAARDYISDLQAFIRAHSGSFLSLIVAQAYENQGINGLGEIDGLRAYFDYGAEVMSGRLDGDSTRVAPRLMVRASFGAVLAAVLFRDWMFPSSLADEKAVNEALIDFVLDGINANPHLV
ncbi:TetR/AcrR family transcriptional regulator [Haliea sp. E17]|uniref:TetR/AcrR family transcriptional regulator n=1 Tax=Haliea sp. E17 TaxID=3401576 RepID=UPI003AAD3D20